MSDFAQPVTDDEINHALSVVERDAEAWEVSRRTGVAGSIHPNLSDKDRVGHSHDVFDGEMMREMCEENGLSVDLVNRLKAVNVALNLRGADATGDPTSSRLAKNKGKAQTAFREVYGTSVRLLLDREAPYMSDEQKEDFIDALQRPGVYDVDHIVPVSGRRYTTIHGDVDLSADVDAGIATGAATHSSNLSSERASCNRSKGSRISYETVVGNSTGLTGGAGAISASHKYGNMRGGVPLPEDTEWRRRILEDPDCEELRQQLRDVDPEEREAVRIALLESLRHHPELMDDPDVKKRTNGTTDMRGRKARVAAGRSRAQLGDRVGLGGVRLAAAPAPAPAPVTPRRKDGGIDRRFKAAREAEAQARRPTLERPKRATGGAQGAFGVHTPSHVRTAARHDTPRRAPAPRTSHFPYDLDSQVRQQSLDYPAPGPKKRDGTLDMRYRQNKDYVAAMGSMGDMRSMSYRERMRGTGDMGSMSSMAGISGMGGASGPLKKNGTPDMRYKVNRERYGR